MCAHEGSAPYTMQRVPRSEALISLFWKNTDENS